MKKITFHGKSGRFSKKARAAFVKVGQKRYILPRDKKEREKVIARAKKRATKPSFSDKIEKQGLTRASSPPSKARYFSETKTLNIPGAKGKTFDIVKWTYELNTPLKLTPRTIKKQIRKLQKNAYPKLLGTFKENKGSNFLFRIDTAYVNENGKFDKVTGVYKMDKDGLSDGRGFSLGRWLNVTKTSRFKLYIDSTFEEFAQTFVTYIGRKGINFGQINALILEVS